MNVLELFAGSCTFSNEAKELGYKTYTSDYKQFNNIDYVVDILEFDVLKVPFKPDLIWASPPCTYFSVASIGKHWNKDHTPKSNNALIGVKYVQKTIDIINYFKPKYWYIENPRGKLRKLDVVKGLEKATIWYCQYGDTRAKPTDIWSNNIKSIYNPNGWQPRKQCFNGNKNCHHQPAPLGTEQTL